jgi:hypothetical protein
MFRAAHCPPNLLFSGDWGLFPRPYSSWRRKLSSNLHSPIHLRGLMFRQGRELYQQAGKMFGTGTNCFPMYLHHVSVSPEVHLASYAMSTVDYFPPEYSSHSMTMIVSPPSRATFNNAWNFTLAPPDKMEEHIFATMSRPDVTPTKPPTHHTRGW